MSNSLFKSSLLVAAICATNAMAYERQHEAHVHGEAEMNVAIEGNVIELVLKSPLANIAGFEHEATSDEDKATLSNAQKALQDAYARVQFPDAAVCMLDEADVHLGEEHGDEDAHEGHAHDKHEHEEHAHEEHAHKNHDHDKHEHEEHAHKDHDHDKHDHEEHAHKEHDHHEHEEGEHGEHRDIHAHYTFKCVKPANLNSVKLDFFTKFPGMESLHVNLLTEKGARQVELTQNNWSIDL